MNRADAWFWWGKGLIFLLGSVGGYAIGDGGGDWPAWVAYVALTLMAADIAGLQEDQRQRTTDSISKQRSTK